VWRVSRIGLVLIQSTRTFLALDRNFLFDIRDLEATAQRTMDRRGSPELKDLDALWIRRSLYRARVGRQNIAPGRNRTCDTRFRKPLLRFMLARGLLRSKMPTLPR
jgi:hypothetical protein